MKYSIFTLIVFCLLTSAACSDNKQAQTSQFSQLLSVDGATVTPEKTLTFPRDHAEHPNYGIEWWYFTANLQTENASPIWLQWTLFRIKSQSVTKDQSWSGNQIYMAHAVVNTDQETFQKEKFARNGVGNAGFAQGDNKLFIDDWYLAGSGADFPTSVGASIDTESGFNLKLRHSAKQVLHGNNGYSQKAPGTELASYYYSHPFLQVTGQVILGGIEHNVTGQGWFDHEWSSEFLSDDYYGWKWFSLHLSEDTKLMLFTLKNSELDDNWVGTLMHRNQPPIVLDDKSLAVQVHTKPTQRYPTAWDISIVEHNINLQVIPRKQDQTNHFSVSYYEGAVAFTGSHRGDGFVEMTGF